ncbi:hypothetical protein GY45DRAFT_1259545 [Cubamyces sp. BRFM 1775]|nr:hypothetical protein GY45DRAFT_1259545 [Cubamyces sp. BRFM 1775]
MVRVTEEAERRLERIAERRRMPPVPDLRFEYSYVRSVAPYVHIDSTTASGKGKEKAVLGSYSGEVAPSAGEVVRVEWGNILWITTRDQLISPLLQGALCHFLRPFGAFLGAHFQAWWSRGARSRDSPETEGNGVQWLRNWLGSILSPSAPGLHVR